VRAAKIRKENREKAFSPAREKRAAAEKEKLEAAAKNDEANNTVQCYYLNSLQLGVSTEWEGSNVQAQRPKYVDHNLFVRTIITSSLSCG